MDQNIAAWMIAGGPKIEPRSVTREREHLYAYYEGRRADRVSLIDRLLSRVRPQVHSTNLVCCPA